MGTLEDVWVWGKMIMTGQRRREECGWMNRVDDNNTKERPTDRPTRTRRAGRQVELRRGWQCGVGEEEKRQRRLGTPKIKEYEKKKNTHGLWSGDFFFHHRRRLVEMT